MNKRETFDYVGEKTALLDALIQAVAAGDRPLGLSTAFNTPQPLELAGRFGYTWTIVDQEHTLLGSQTMIDLIRASEWSRCVTFVKVNDRDPVLVRDALDAGASGVQMPGTDTVEDLERSLEWMRYGLRGGTRGICPTQRSLFYHTNRYSGHDDWEKAEMDFADRALLMPTVESVTAMRNLEEMLEYDECPIWHIGPMDLALSLGLNHSDPAMADVLLRTVRQIAARIHKAGKYVCYPLVPPPPPSPAERAENAPLGPDPIGQMIAAIGVDMPYTLDSSCMGYGMAAMLSARDSSLHEGGEE